MASSGFGKQAIDERKLVPLLRNVHPLASPEFDLRPLRLTSPMDRMLLVPKRSPEARGSSDKTPR
jgi:hypothetical protein